MSSLHFFAGQDALHSITNQGLAPERVKAMVGASGGPKWLMLRHLDNYLISEFFQGSTHPVQLLGSSIGSWRFACYATSNPQQAMERFEQAYIEQRYYTKPSPDEVSQKSQQILSDLLGQLGARDAMLNPRFRLNIMAVRSKGLCQSEHRAIMGTGVVLAALGNMASRRSLGLSFERALFSVDPSSTPFNQLDDLPNQTYQLTEQNLCKALMASASIPLVMSGVTDIQGANTGVYRDGGITDYHFDIPFLSNAGQPDDIVLYPHFSPHVAPGWFDKSLKWRTPDPDNYRNVLLVTPTAEFISRLPQGKIPDRTDFVNLDNEERIANWHKVLEMTRELADELHETLSQNRLGERLKPLPFTPH